LPKLVAATGAIAALLLTVGPASANASGPTTLAASDAGGPLQVTIKRDPHGIPNIIGNSFADVGFGYGYAFAQDNICTIAESYVTVDAQRSRYTGSGVEGTFGPDGSYPQRGNGFGANNLNSDFFYQRIIDKHIVEGLVNEPPPRGPVEEIKQGVRGYVAGYNKYLADTGVNNLPDPRCRGADWVKPITEMDAYRRFYQLALLASQSVAIDGIASQKTPGASGGSLGDPSDIANQLGQYLPLSAIGSNAVALGSQGTANGSGMMLGNPHFPWDGPERFYQAHLIIPGQVNVSGGSLYGVPLILIGHTDNLAWSHTVSTAYRFTPFQEQLVPGSPTTYLYDGMPKQMNTDSVTVMARNPTTGQLEPRTRTIYSTIHGPVFTDLVGVPLPWTPTTAFTMGDVNATNFRYLNHFFFTNQAESVNQLDQIEKTYQGIPWVNTIAADSSGKAYYADIGAIPNVSNQKAQDCDTAVGAATFSALGLPVLDGSRSTCEWGTDPTAAAPGIFGPSDEPSLTRDDYVTNSNDSYWLSNPAHPLENFARIIGDERTERSLRTRLGLRIVQQRLDGSDGAGGTKFTRQKLQDAVFNNRQYAGELWRDPLVAMCNANPTLVNGDGDSVDVSAACSVLAAWDLHDNLDSNGAILFRRFASNLLASASVGGVVTDPTIYSTMFSASDPVNTPNGLNTSNPKVKQALADAVTDLTDAGIPLTAPLQGYQYEKRGAEKIPIHGGPGTLGVFNAINVSWSSDPAEPGYPNVPHGSSFVMVTSFGGSCPDDRSILTYSQSSNPNSPYFADQTRMFSEKQWVNPPFCPDEVQNDPSLSTTVLQGCLPEGCGGDGGTGAQPGSPGAAPGPGGGNPSVIRCQRKRKAHHHRSRRKKRVRCQGIA
jgi:acyl-homoserine-lactone acylase